VFEYIRNHRTGKRFAAAVFGVSVHGGTTNPPASNEMVWVTSSAALLNISDFQAWSSFFAGSLGGPLEGTSRNRRGILRNRARHPLFVFWRTIMGPQGRFSRHRFLDLPRSFPRLLVRRPARVASCCKRCLCAFPKILGPHLGDSYSWRTDRARTTALQLKLGDGLLSRFCRRCILAGLRFASSSTLGNPPAMASRVPFLASSCS